MRRAASVLVVERTRRRASTRRWLMRSTTSRGRRAMTCGARRWLMCWTSFRTRRRGIITAIVICTVEEASTSARRLRWSGLPCAWPRRCGGAGFLSGRRRLINCCSVLKPSTVARARRGAVLWLFGAVGRSWCSRVHLYAYSERRRRRDQNGQHTHETTEVGASHGPAPGRCRARTAALLGRGTRKGPKAGVRPWRDLSMVIFRAGAEANDDFAL